MGQISATTGLSSGINISGTISQLMAIDSQPVTALTNTDTTLTSQETAVTQLSALLLSVQGVTQSLGQASTYGSQSATSSDTSALSASVTGTPTAGTYQYTPLQMAQSQQLLSSGLPKRHAGPGRGHAYFPLRQHGRSGSQFVRDQRRTRFLRGGNTHYRSQRRQRRDQPVRCPKYQ